MSVSTSKPYECLICSTPIYNTNLGIDACRACTVFYRRHVADNKQLACRKGTDDCVDKNTRPLCRKCRYLRFAKVLAQSTTGKKQTNTQRHTSNSSGSNSIDLQDNFIDHRSFKLFSSCTDDSSFFDRMRKAYSMLCVVRKCGELGIVELDEEKSIQGDGMKFYPKSNKTKIACLRILFAGLIELFDTTFNDFEELPADNKTHILDKSIKFLQTLDGVYRGVHHFPNEDALCPSYMCFSNEKVIESIASKFANTKMKDVACEMKNNALYWMRHVRACYKRVNPSNEEFLAMMGLCLWSNDVSRISDEYMDTVSNNRSAIMSELHKLYTRQGLTDYSARLGEILCLIETIEKNAERIGEDIVMIKLMRSINEEMAEMKSR